VREQCGPANPGQARFPVTAAPKSVPVPICKIPQQIGKNITLSSSLFGVKG
jgi:hypothetical protein